MKNYKCLRCNHEWYPRSEKMPKWCPACNSPYWNRERKQQGKLVESGGVK